MDNTELKKAMDFFWEMPSVIGVASGFHDKGLWWIKIQIDIHHKLAWRVVQELAYVLNYVSISERLPTVFYPVSPPPYLNGGPQEFLSWIIENEDENFTPKDMTKWLNGRLPNPINDESKWIFDKEE